MSHLASFSFKDAVTRTMVTPNDPDMHEAP